MTQFIDIAADFDINEKSPEPVKAKSSPITLVLSLLVHGLVLFLLFYFSGFTSKSPPANQQPEIAAIKATLYFPPPPAPITEPAIVEPPVQQEQIEIPQAEEPARQITEPEISQPEAVEPEVIETESIQDNVTMETPVAKKAPGNSQQNNPGRIEQLNQSLSRHLNSLHKKQVTEMSKDASRNWQQDYYQRQTSGYKPPVPRQIDDNYDIDTGRKYTENMLETGIEMSAGHQSLFKPTEIDCSGTTGEVVGTLAGVFGGRVKCSELPAFQRYIDARLNKK